MTCFRSSVVILLVLALAIPVWPQASNSTVRGSVADSQGAVIPNAKVILTNTATGIVRDSITNNAGIYVFPGVIPGPYRVRVEQPGFQTFEGVLTVQVQQDASVDVVMQVAGAMSSVDVFDVTPLVNPSSPSLGSSLERKRIEQLPVNGRGYQNLLVTVPGVQWRSHGHGIGGMIQGNGLRSGSNTLVVDGAAQNEVWEGWDVARQPSLDAVEELRVEVNNASAKFARPTSVVMSTRSGTNEFHGVVFYTNRNSAYGVARRREDTFTKPPYVNRNEYGISLGGPVIIPKLYHGRNRTFFFWNWEQTRFLTNTTTRMSVPTAEMRNGDFRGLVDAQGRRFTLYDPFTTQGNWSRQPLAYNGVQNVIDPARISPVAKFLFDHTALPTHPSINPLVDANWIGTFRRPLLQDTRNIRIDHRISESDLVFFRFAYNQHDEQYGANSAPFLPVDGFRTIEQTTRWWPNHTFSGTWNHTFSPTLTNEVLISGLRDWHNRGAGDNRTNYARLLGLPNPFSAVNWPVVDNMNFGITGSTYSLGGEQPFYLVSNMITAQDNAVKVLGAHELNFGFQFKFEDVPKSIVSAAGNFSVDTSATSLYDPSSTPENPISTPFTGHPIANLFLGQMNYATTFRRPWTFLRRQEYAPYFQDNWKVNQRLSLTLGLRYEFRTPLHDKNGLLTSFSPELRAFVVGSSVENFLAKQATLPANLNALNAFGGKVINYEEAGQPEHLVYNNWKQIGPRLGFAYRVLSGAKAFVMRGGYRVSYYTQPITDWFGSQNNQQIVSANFQNSVTNTALSPDGLPNYGLRSVPRYTAGVNTADDSIIDINDTRTIARGFTAIQIDPYLTDPKVQEWNLTIEKEIADNMVMRLTYVGNRTTNILQTINLNESVPEYIWYRTRGTSLPTGEFAGVARRPYDQQVYGAVNRLASTGYANWNGFQAEMERRFSKGLGFQIFYIMGKSLAAIGTASIPTTAGPPAGTIQQVESFLPGAVPTDLDERNRFLNYQLDTNTPQHQVRWNWIADIPVGKGKFLGGSLPGFLDNIFGGWQIAGTGTWRTNHVLLPTNYYPTDAPLEVYGEKYKIEDCRSGVCFPGFLYYNGYIPANRINSVDAQGRPNGVMGVPENYKPAVAPLIPWGSTTLPPNAPANTNLSQFWDTNSVWVRLNNNTVQRVNYNDNLVPWRNQYIRVPNQWFMDASLFKNTKITEKVSLRVNIDIFNVLNNPNNPTAISNTNDGILTTRNSGSPARVMQITIRLSF
jgi:Carboxypeptidase regulatory-like domain